MKLPRLIATTDAGGKIWQITEGGPALVQFDSLRLRAGHQRPTCSQ
jgi:hypothetical protein